MPIDYDCSSNDLVVMIEGVKCNCASQQQKVDLCQTILKMNQHEAHCRVNMGAPNLPPYNWSIIPAPPDCIDIAENGQIAVRICGTPQDLALINAIFANQISAGTGWCRIR